ncbi:MAG: hypothetical protein GX295_08885 [Syntrophomonadaceae bacterium]|nr:hypothetical protein [Syntrophomonadaceae bacterium]
MTFSDFARLLYPFCGGEKNVWEFVLLLVDNIIEDPPDDEKDINPLAHLSASTLEKYFNGTREPAGKNVSLILQRLDKGKFEEFIGELPYDTLNLIGNALRKYGFEVDAYEVPGKSADIFASILERQANLTTSKKAKPAPTKDEIPDTDFFLLLEANSICPLCTKPLVENKNNNSLKNYKITHIIPPNPSKEEEAELGDLIDLSTDVDAFNNKIALCLDCANRYSLHTTQDECEHLMDIKNRLYRNFAANEVLNKMYLEEQIEAVIRQISVAPPEQLSDTLNYKALRVRDKIPGSNIPLLIKTEGFVIQYYRFIESVFSQLEREGRLNSKNVAVDVRRTYDSLVTYGLTQDEIFARLTGWFRNKTNAQSALACEILVAFFVQSCEVYDALTK